MEENSVKSKFFNNGKKYFQLFFGKLADLRFSSVIGSEGGNKNRFAGLEGGVLLELSSSQKETIRHQFDSFCKSILRNTRKNHIRYVSRLAENEITFSELSEREMDSLCTIDDYPAEHFHFDVEGEDVTITDERLFNALSSLPTRKRDIVLMAGYHGKSDAEIARKLNMVSRTVQNQRTSSLAKLKKMLGGSRDEQA
jgi:RNA polymerase sigma factor (sigma-70 family)